MHRLNQAIEKLDRLILFADDSINIYLEEVRKLLAGIVPDELVTKLGEIFEDGGGET